MIALSLRGFHQNSAKDQSGQNIQSLIAGLDAGYQNVVHQNSVRNMPDGMNDAHKDHHGQSEEKGRGEEFANDVDDRRFLYAQRKNERKEENGSSHNRHSVQFISKRS